MEDEVWVYANGTSVEGYLGEYKGNGVFSIFSDDD